MFRRLIARILNRSSTPKKGPAEELADREPLTATQAELRDAGKAAGMGNAAGGF